MQSTHSYMRKLTALCALSLLPATAAHAQIVTNSQALDTLEAPALPPKSQAQRVPALTASRPVPTSTQTAPKAQPAHHSAQKTPAPTATPQAAQTPAKATPQAQATAAATAPNTATASTAQPAATTHTTTPPPGHPAPLPTIPAAPPPPPVIPDPTPNVELHPFPVPPQPAVNLKAVGVVSDIAAGLRLTFAAGSADLNPTTHQAILSFGQRLADKPQARALIDAYSSSVADDPSLPRRMALARGLAARSVLMNAGIPSTRIYLRVIGVPQGSAATSGTQDHIDLYQSDEKTP